MGHPMAAAAGLEVLNIMERRQLLPHVRDQGHNLMEKLNQRLGQHPHIGDIRGKGLFVGLEIVENRETKAPFAPSRRIAKTIKSKAFDIGLMCYPMSGTIDGQNGDHILLAPPFIINDQELDLMVDLLHQTIEAVCP